MGWVVTLVLVANLIGRDFSGCKFARWIWIYLEYSLDIYNVDRLVTRLSML